jgi:hypothetical protein
VSARFRLFGGDGLLTLMLERSGDSENTFLTSWMLPPTDWTAGDPSLGVGIEWPTSLWASATTELEQGL